MSSPSENLFVTFSDAKLLAASAAGQAQAMAELYDRYHAQLFGLALKILQNRSLAEDVIQDVFMTIWKKAGQYQNARGNALAWMMVLCRNRCIDVLRARSRARQRSYEIEAEALQELPDQSTANPLDNVAFSDQKILIGKALEGLPPEQRSLIEMSYFQGFSQRELAEQLELPLGTVKTRMRSGMQKLRNTLAEFFNQ